MRLKHEIQRLKRSIDMPDLASDEADLPAVADLKVPSLSSLACHYSEKHSHYISSCAVSAACNICRAHG